MASRFSCALLAAALLLGSAVPSLADNTPLFARRLKQLGFAEGFANLPGFTQPVTTSTQTNTANTNLSPTQPGCTDYIVAENTCSACGQGYVYVASTTAPVCQCAPGYTRASDGTCTFSGTGPAPSPVPSPAPGTTVPGLPGNYGGPIPSAATDPTGFAAFTQASIANVNSILRSLNIAGFTG